jgi:hypothetical protein
MMFGDSPDEEYSSDVDLLGACLALPAMRCAFGRNLGLGEYDPDDQDVPLQTLLAQSSDLELLHLEYSRLNKPELFALLRAPKKLKTFVYEFGIQAWVWVPPVSISDIAEALQPHHAWLEELCLIHDDSFRSSSYSTPISLREYTSLKMLKIAPVFLLGQEVLNSGISGDPEKFCEDFGSRFPASLEVLHFTYDLIHGTETYVVLALEILVRQKSHFFPNLKSLTLEDFTVPRVARFIELAKGMGIKTGTDNGWDHGPLLKGYNR